MPRKRDTSSQVIPLFHKSKPHIDSSNDKTDSVIYYNANVRNSNTALGAQSAIAAKFDQSISNGAIVDIPENYYLSIVRFSISHASIPIYFFNTTPNYYTVTIGNNPATPLIYSPIGNGYNAYGFSGLQPVFYYQQFVQMINVALNTAHIAAGGLALLGPFMDYDPNTERFSINIPPNYVNVAGIYPPTFNVNRDINFNSNLFQQLQYFDSLYNGLNQPLGKDYTLNVSAYFGLTNAITTPVAIAGYFKVTQERSALYLLNVIQSIVFRTSSLPTTKEFVGKNDGSGNAGNIPILVDFIPDQSAARDLSQYQYVPNGPYKLINLTNSIPITSFDYEILLATRDDILYPLYLEPGEVCQVKFAFIKKSLFDNDFVY